MKIRESGGGVKVGDRFGRLVVTGWQFRVRDGKGSTKWVVLCQCDCGTLKTIDISNLVKRNKKSCGEFQCHANITHGCSGEKLYGVWKRMHQRCRDPNTMEYKNYGGRGIIVCNEWNDFCAFKTWAHKNGYRPGLTIDRKDNNLGYSPETCVWTGYIEQNNNKRSNRILEYRGVKMSMIQWARQTGINYSTLRNRIRRGWSVEKALTKPAKK